MDYQNIAEIVLIDDDPVQHLITRRMLKFVYDGFYIKNFSNGLEALTYLKERIPDTSNNSITLIFLDLNMPVMDGFDFLEKHRYLNKDITANDQLIILSSTILRSDKLLAINYSELKGYYEKPLSMESLKQIFDSLIGLMGHSKELK